jgi:hypothetical protein
MIIRRLPSGSISSRSARGARAIEPLQQEQTIQQYARAHGQIT